MAWGFNPRAREGRDKRDAFRAARLRRFNPRAREGRDVRCLMPFFAQFKVSIHAPARGATGHEQVLYRYAHVSIHAPARGATC